MIKRFYILLLAIVASVGMSYAAGIPCTAADLGKVLCTDGSIYATVSEATAASKTAAAVIAYVDTENGKALALALADDGGEMEWATAKTTAAAHTPAVSGSTWTLASKDDWDNMITAAGSYTALRDGFSAVGGTNMLVAEYWTSTEGTYSGTAIGYRFQNGIWTDPDVDDPLHVRACIAFDIFATPAELPGAFTINANGDKIVFSKGNLQATTTDLGANWTWDFAPNQWSLIGNAVANNAIKGNKKVSANGTVDLFGWSTAATYYGINESWNNDDYAGDFVDWGALMGTEWRTLSRAEFYYIVYSRAQAAYKRGQATVNGVPGYVLLPDAWTLPSGLSFTNSIENYTTNQYNGADWTAMESAGAVFLPAAGVREGTDIYQVNLYGWYWASTPNETDGGKAYYLWFDKSSQGVTEYNRWKSKSVRLVTEAPIPPYEAAIKLINEIPNPVVLTAECKAKIDAARAAYDALSDEDKAKVTNITTLTTAEAAFDNVMNIWLSGDCDAILWKDTTLTIRKHAGEGNGAMADYTDYYGDNTAPWFNSHWYNPQPGDIVIKSVTLEEGVTHIGENAFGWMSELKTITIPSSVTSIGEDAFYWSKAVDDIYLSADPSNLTWVLPYSADNQFKPEKATRCHVPADLLTAYQEKFGTLNMTFVGDLDPITPLTPEQQQALDAAKGLINAIPSPVVYTPACKDAIDAARAAYDALTPDMLKQLVSNYATLTAAEATYANLKDVVVVEAKINNIPSPITLKLATRDSIESARAAYDALTDDQKLLVSNYQTLLDAEAELATLNPGGGAPAGALNGKFTINAGGDQIAFAKGNLQATTTDLGANWTWSFAANQWNYLGIAVANNKITGNKTVSENGTVDLFGWSTNATYYGINNSYKAVDYIGDFVDWGPNMGAGWRTLTKDEWAYLLQHSSNGKATVNDKNGYIFLPDNWSGPAFTPNPDNFTTNVYSGDDWTAMENAGAVFLPSGPARNRIYALIANDAKYCSSTSLNNDTSYVFTIYYNQSQSACTGTNRAYGCMVRLVSEGGGATPLDSAQAVKDLIEAIPMPVTLEDACVNAVQAARDAYNALSDAAKGALDAATVQKLNQAITDYTALIQAGADEVIAKINNIPQPVTLKLATRDSINNARAAYDALTDDQKLLVSNYDVLTAAEATMATLNPGGDAPDGAVSGKFSIDESSVVYFSKGNLQATTADLGANWTWGFAAHQYDTIGDVAANNAINGNGTVSANGTVDLFGWSTSATKYGIHNGTNSNISDYAGDFVDWGATMGDGWFTLSKEQWYCLFNTRTGDKAATVNSVADCRYTKATINTDGTAVKGFILFPDGGTFAASEFTAVGSPNAEDVDYTTTCTTAQWNALQAKGCVFLPAAGRRYGVSVSNEGSNGYYWSSSPKPSTDDAYFVFFYSGGLFPASNDFRCMGLSVRLVIEAPASPLAAAQAVKDLIEAIPAEITTDDACVKAIEDARAAYDELSEAAQGALDAATVQKLTDAEAAYAILIKAEADAVVAKINNIPTPIELKLATRDSIESARAAYEALNVYQKPMVTNYQKLLDAEAALAELNKGGSTPVDIVWDGNTGIANVSPTTTSPAYEGMTVTVGKGSSFSTYQSRLYFTFNSQPNGGFIFANENGTNITKVVIESTTALTSTMTEVDRMGSGWVISNENKTATWTGNADSVKIWEGQHFANYWVVDMITFTVSASSTPLDSAQAVKDLIDAIPQPVEYPTSGPAIAAALVAYQQLSDAAKGALDVADVQKMTDAAAQYTALDAIAAIDAIPAEIVYDPAVKAAIETAREKYDALIDASKALVDDEVVAKLTNAEKAWADLVALIEHNVSYMGKDGELKNEKVALLHIPNPAPDFNGYEFVRWDVKAGNFLEEGLRIKAIYTPIITTNPVAYDTLVYNGTAQTLVTAGVAKEGHIEYRINDGEWSTELPKATFAAAYVVYYKLVREGHADYIADPINVTIAKAPVTYTAPTAVENLVYNASNQTLIAAGQTNDGTFEYSLDPTLLDSWKAELPQAKDAGTYSVYYRVKGDLNHLDSTAVDPIAVTIAKAALTATADDKNVIYGDAVPAYTVTYAGWQGDDDASVLTGDIAFACEYAPTSNIGSYVITPSGVSAANYNITFVNGKVTVAQATLMITAEDKNVTYGDAVPEYTATYSGWKNTDGASVVSGLIYTCEYAPTSNVGDYTITPSGATATNYNISYTNGKVTVAQAALMITAEDKNVTYGDAVPEYTATYSGWKNADDASVVSGLVYTCEYAPTSNVDEYSIVPSGATATNYNISYTNGKVTVAQAALMITADDKNVIYGDAVPEYTATYSGWKNSDDASVVSNLAYTCEYAPTSNVGDYTITPSGATAQNYAISYTNGKVTVAQATLTVTAEDKSVTYGDAAPAFTATYSGWKNTDGESVVSGLTLTSEYLVTSNVGTYDIVPANATALNYTFVYVNGTLTVNQAPLMITADDKSVEYGEVAPAFTASYSGWKNTDDESVVSGLAYTTPYAPGSYIGTYAINPNSATALNYAITFVDGTLTVNKAHVYVSDAEAQIAKFADGHANAVVLEQGVLNGIKLNDQIAHVTTAAFSSADVAENLTITLFYELTGDAALLNNYNLDPTSDIFTTEGVIIEPFIPDDETEPEDPEAAVEEGIEIYAYGYCDGSGYSLRYHLESGNPDQYMIDFADSRFTDVDWTNLTIVGKDGTIDIEIPVDMPTGDYTMTVYFRDSRFTWLESKAITVTFHVNLPETYVRPLFDNVIALVDTCNCLTDIQWYWRANSTDTWVAIPGANGYYYHSDTKLEGEFFVYAKMNGEPTYTCAQADLETLYGDDTKQAKVQAYPNPVITTTTVTIENSENNEHNVRIVNLMGAEAERFTFEGNETVVDMTDYPQGNYMISVDGIVVKVMKQ
ncbi:MAG: leucine-rich repeat protein [Paludibacteraceae bacterium]|nr:leucine-rich repeat protein [Paludibacteraceae bacterium]